MAKTQEEGLTKLCKQEKELVEDLVSEDYLERIFEDVDYAYENGYDSEDIQEWYGRYFKFIGDNVTTVEYDKQSWKCKETVSSCIFETTKGWIYQERFLEEDEDPYISLQAFIPYGTGGYQKGQFMHTAINPAASKEVIDFYKNIFKVELTEEQWYIMGFYLDIRFVSDYFKWWAKHKSTIRFSY